MSPSQVLTPNFSSMPPELCKIPRWLNWKDSKVPYCSNAMNSKASSTDPNDWATFSQAQTAFGEGGYLGVGFVLSGDGIVGVDLDKCVYTGEPDPVALGLLDRIGCQYIELSPSGTGLRGFGYAELIKGTRGVIDGINAELYATERYLTVTGHTLKQGPLVSLPGYLAAANAIREGQIQKRQKTLKQSSVSSVSSVNGIPVSAVPTQPGMRNRCLFELARYLKGTWPTATRLELKPIVAQWHEEYVSIIDTKDFSVTWMDFLNAWDKVEMPHGSTLASVLDQIDQTTALPDAILAYEYSDVAIQLVRICMALQLHSRSDPFFIGARKAGELLGINHADAAKMLSVLVSDGVLRLVSKGAGAKASRYQMGVTPWHA
jgi:hypothetical protein